MYSESRRAIPNIIFAFILIHICSLNIFRIQTMYCQGIESVKKSLKFSLIDSVVSIFKVNYQRYDFALLIFITNRA